MIMAEQLTIFSQNCRGDLSVASKRRDLFQYVRAKKYNIICLQDVHINENLESFIKAEWGYDIFFSSYTTMSRGVMILLNNNFEQKVKTVKTDKNGNYIILDIEIQGKDITLANIYGPNEDNPNFYENLIKNIADFENENVIVCGDWNLILDTEKEYIEEVKKLISEVKSIYATNSETINVNDILDNEIVFNINDQLFLETLLMTIRGNTIKYSSIKKRKKLEKENKLEQEINELEEIINNDFSNADEDKIVNLARKKETLIEIRKEKIEGVMLRSRSRYQDLGEKPSKYFFKLENRNYANKAMTKIIENDGTEHTETNEILKCQWQFYENLYNDYSVDLDERSIGSVIGENENKLSNEDAEKLEGEIS